MDWDINARDGVVIVTMRSNPVNKMNPAFFDDLHRALDRLDRDHPRIPMVLTGEGSIFSAGLDFEDVFPRFARGDHEEVAAWFARFRDSLLRVFELPRRTIAAVNGHAFAGGLILALCCDHRIGAAASGRLTLNEVAIGIPMPGVYVEIVRHAVGTRVATELMLDCALFEMDEALEAGFLHALVPRAELIDRAVAQATALGPQSYSVYAVSKAALLAPTLESIRGPARAFDDTAIRAVTSPESLKAQAAALATLKARSARDNTR